jgi:glycolate oxidase FAD binding subunit
MSEPRVIERWQARIREAAANGAKLRPRGGGSKDFYGGPLVGEVLDTREWSGLVAYEPTELVITARAGTPLAEIEAALAARGQMLAFEPPRFLAAGDGRAAPATSAAAGGVSCNSTLGGVVAAGLAGPRRQQAGSVRDYVLGVRLIDGRGELLHFGGEVMKNVAGYDVSRLMAGLAGPRRQQAGSVRDYVLGVRLIDGRGELLHFGGEVMKNVAGYDVSRLMAGSLGTLGVLVEVSLKVLPRPVAETTLVFELPEAVAIERLNAWSGQPLPLSASCWIDGVLSLRLSGAAAAVGAAASKLGGERHNDAADFWTSLRDQTHAFFAAHQAPLWRLALPSASAPLGLPGAPLIEWGGGQRWLVSDAPAPVIQAAAAAAGGHATLFAGASDAQRAAVFTPLAPPLLAIHRRLKTAFDPAGVFSPGRLYPEF